MRKPTERDIRDQFYYNTEYRSEYFIKPAYEIMESCLENNFIPDELLCGEDSINFYFNSEDINSMDNLSKRSIWIEVKDETTFIQTEENGNYFTDKFDIEKVEEYKDFLNARKT